MSKCPCRKFTAYQYGYDKNGDRELCETVEYFAECEKDKCEYYSEETMCRGYGDNKPLVGKCKLSGLLLSPNK